ncbi:MAG: tetratricopeptide repeat protein [Rhodospirillales bacterium]|nr:tetratricopeptide repeat protein [Rhodospirillales bacterium]
MEAGRYTQAFHHFDVAVRDAPANPEAHLGLISCLLSLNLVDAAQQAARQALQRVVTIDLRFVNALSLLQLNRFDEAQAEAEALSADGYTYKGFLIAAAVSLIQTPSHPVALPSAEDGDTQGNLLRLQLRALIAERDNQPIVTWSAIQDILAAAPNRPNLQMLAARMAARMGLASEAVQAALRAVELDPDAAASRVLLISLFMHFGARRAALTAAASALEQFPDHPELLQAMGVILAEEGNCTEAIAMFRRAEAMAPNSGPLLAGLAYALENAGEDDAALSAYVRARGRTPQDSDLLLGEARALIQLGRYDAAEHLLAQPGDTRPDAVRMLGELCQLPRERMEAAAPSGVIVVGAFSSTEAYANLTRQFVRGWGELGVPVRLIEQDRKGQVPLPESSALELEALSRPVRASTVLWLGPASWVVSLPEFQTVNYTMFETSRIPASFKARSSRHDLIIVPTDSSRRAWIDSGISAERVRVSPLGVTPLPLAEQIAIPEGLHNPLFRERRIRLMNISSWTRRKNLDGMLRVWLRTTTKQDDAVLLLKLGKGDGTGDSQARFQRMFHHLAQSVGKRPEDAAPIIVMAMTATDDKMLALMAGATHYWSMSHGEGWDMPTTQAGAMGLEILAPDHSAYQAYLDDTVGRLIRSHETPVPTGVKDIYEGLSWWQPDEDHACEVLTEVLRGKDDGRRFRLRNRLNADFGWDTVARRLLNVLSDAGMAPPLP